MQKGLFEILENRALTEKVCRLRLGGEVSAIERPGQFVQISVPSGFLRRPFSVGEKDGESFTVHYELVGRGTEALSRLRPGDKLDVLTGLGNGFALSRAGAAPLLIGGGTGVSPLLWLARELLQSGAEPRVILGFNTANDVFLAEDFQALGIEPVITTVDGSRGTKGFVTDVMDQPHSFFYACGPEAMLRAVCRQSRRGGQLSLDRRMGCGFGACMGCTVMTVGGPKRICREGPVLDKEEIVWED